MFRATRNNRPLSNPAGEAARRTGVYTPVHEDSSTVSTKQCFSTDQKRIAHQRSVREIHSAEKYDIIKQDNAAPSTTENNYLALQWLSVIFAEIAILALLIFAFPLVTLTTMATAIGTYQIYQFFTTPKDPNSGTNNDTSTYCI